MKLFQALLAGLSFFERLERYIKFYSNYDLFEGTMSLRRQTALYGSLCKGAAYLL